MSRRLQVVLVLHASGCFMYYSSSKGREDLVRLVLYIVSQDNS